MEEQAGEGALALTEVMESLPERFRPRLAGNMAATIQFRFKGVREGDWHLVIAAGVCQVGRGLVDEPGATVMMEAADFVGINTAAIPAPLLFWSGRIEIEGDVGAVVGLAPVMGWQ